MGQMANCPFPHSFLTILRVHGSSMLAFFLQFLRFASEKVKGFVTVCT